MPRLDQRRRGPRRRQTGAELVTNPFEALRLLDPREPLPDTRENCELIASARRLQNRGRLERARRDLERDEPEHESRRWSWELDQKMARQVVEHFLAHPELYYIDGEATREHRARVESARRLLERLEAEREAHH